MSKYDAFFSFAVRRPKLCGPIRPLPQMREHDDWPDAFAPSPRQGAYRGSVSHFFIGTSGWSYPRWRGDFYPRGLVHRRELEHLSQHTTSAEINGSFYSLQRPTSYAAWRDQVPDDFVFAVKGGRYITHLKRLRDVESALANFFASGVLALPPKLGPSCGSFPPVSRMTRTCWRRSLRCCRGPRRRRRCSQRGTTPSSRKTGR